MALKCGRSVQLSCRAADVQYLHLVCHATVFDESPLIVAGLDNEQTSKLPYIAFMLLSLSMLLTLPCGRSG